MRQVELQKKLCGVGVPGAMAILWLQAFQGAAWAKPPAATLPTSAAPTGKVAVSSAPQKPAAATQSKTGTVQIVRGTRGPEPQLTEAQGDRYVLAGPQRDELLRLSGHHVQVWGEHGTKKLLQRTFVVERYELLEVDGRKPFIGVLIVGGQGSSFILQQTDRSVVVEPPAGLVSALRAQHGCKLWLVGTLTASVLRPSQFGSLRCKSPEVLKFKKETKS